MIEFISALCNGELSSSQTGLVFVILYFLIGIVVGMKYIKLKYHLSDEDASNSAECRKGMFNVFMMFLIAVWPYILFKYIRIKNGKQISRSKDKQ
jgi:uncharacterized membrane protein